MWAAFTASRSPEWTLEAKEATNERVEKVAYVAAAEYMKSPSRHRASSATTKRNHVFSETTIGTDSGTRHHKPMAASNRMKIKISRLSSPEIPDLLNEKSLPLGFHAHDRSFPIYHEEPPVLKGSRPCPWQRIGPTGHRRCYGTDRYMYTAVRRRNLAIIAAAVSPRSSGQGAGVAV